MIELVRMAAIEAAGPVTAVFSGRDGGVSAGPYASLNVGCGVPDAPAAVWENRRRLLEAARLDPERCVWASQVHGTEVAVVTGADAGRKLTGIDGLATAEPGLALAVVCADCSPVFLYDPVTPAVGMVHAGWRGAVAGAAFAGVKAMVQAFGSDPARLLAAVGPSIGPCCYEVDEAVAQAAAGSAAAGRGLLIPTRPGHYLLDLWRLNVLALEGAGVRSEAISVAGICTRCNHERFFSHRASGGLSGRGAGLIALRSREG